MEHMGYKARTEVFYTFLHRTPNVAKIAAIHAVLLQCRLHLLATSRTCGAPAVDQHSRYTLAAD